MRKARQSLGEWLGVVAGRKPVATCIAMTCVVLGCLCLLFWFTVFSGLSSTADFIYAGF